MPGNNGNLSTRENCLAASPGVSGSDQISAAFQHEANIAVRCGKGQRIGSFYLLTFARWNCSKAPSKSPLSVSTEPILL